MIIYPVLDLMNGTVVHGVRGARECYRPIRSSLVDSCEPLEVARALREASGLGRLYVADLDAIGGGRIAADCLASLVAEGFELLVDCGIRSPESVDELVALGVTEVVAALETLPGPDLLARIVEGVGVERVVFSLDCRGDLPLASGRGWGGDDITKVARRAREAGATRMLLLDLERVGSTAGPAPPALVSRLDTALPGCSWLVGGGVRRASDLARLLEAGARGALVATALHQARLSRDELAAFERAELPGAGEVISP